MKGILMLAFIAAVLMAGCGKNIDNAIVPSAVDSVTASAG